MTIALRFMTLWLVTVLLACCASQSPAEVVDRQGASEFQPGSTPSPIAGPVEGAAPSATLPKADVAWDNRVDFEPWAAPLPPGQDGWMTEPPSRWPDLRARLVLPPTVTPGETVDYVLALRNIAAMPVDLRPCGGYEQEVMGVGAGLAAVSVEGGSSTFRLSCDADPILSPAESRRYAMRIVVPRNLTGDEALFRWGFVDNMADYEAQSWIELATG